MARIAKGRQVAAGVNALVVPGSGLVKLQAEEEGLDKIIKAAGFEWREPGCSMCLAMNPDKLEPGERCASTSNRNFEGRQVPPCNPNLLNIGMVLAQASQHRDGPNPGQCRRPTTFLFPHFTPARWSWRALSIESLESSRHGSPESSMRPTAATLG